MSRSECSDCEYSPRFPLGEVNFESRYQQGLVQQLPCSTIDTHSCCLSMLQGLPKWPPSLKSSRIHWKPFFFFFLFDLRFKLFSFFKDVSILLINAHKRVQYIFTQFRRTALSPSPWVSILLNDFGMSINNAERPRTLR